MKDINWRITFIYLQSKGPPDKNLIILYVIFEDVTSMPSVWALWGTMVKFWNNQADVKDICSNQDANDEYLLNVTFIRGFRSFVRCVLVAIGHQYQFSKKKESRRTIYFGIDFCLRRWLDDQMSIVWFLQGIWCYQSATSRFVVSGHPSRSHIWDEINKKKKNVFLVTRSRNIMLFLGPLLR